jgi:hypothetical protein
MKGLNMIIRVVFAALLIPSALAYADSIVNGETIILEDHFEGPDLPKPIVYQPDDGHPPGWIFYSKYDDTKAAYENESSGILSLTYPGGTKKPWDGPVNGPIIESDVWVHYGEYSARFTVPRCNDNEQLVTGFFTLRNIAGEDRDNDKTQDNHEIDIEFLGSAKKNEPIEWIYLSLWKNNQDNDDNSKNFTKVTRAVNVRTGEIRQTPSGKEIGNHERGYPELAILTEQLPEKIPDFDAGNYYTYGFDWKEHFVKFWVINPANNNKILLWDYRDQRYIPTQEGNLLFNLWYSKDWHQIGSPEKGRNKRPAGDSSMRIDWVRYINSPDTGFFLKFSRIDQAVDHINSVNEKYGNNLSSTLQTDSIERYNYLEACRFFAEKLNDKPSDTELITIGKFYKNLITGTNGLFLKDGIYNTNKQFLFFILIKKFRILSDPISIL